MRRPTDVGWRCTISEHRARDDSEFVHSSLDSNFHQFKTLLHFPGIRYAISRPPPFPNPMLLLVWAGHGDDLVHQLDGGSIAVAAGMRCTAGRGPWGLRQTRCRWYTSSRVGCAISSAHGGFRVVKREPDIEGSQYATDSEISYDLK